MHPDCLRKRRLFSQTPPNLRRLSKHTSRGPSCIIFLRRGTQELLVSGADEEKVLATLRERKLKPSLHPSTPLPAYLALTSCSLAHSSRRLPHTLAVESDLLLARSPKSAP